ncbi:MAG: glutamate--tRNA ligase [Candidatus Aminicenantes bacterium]|nr:glutamate--tRNA ligase [Candidatus Aminicenantes bacterium]
MVRVRFAPSPTGYLHIGAARTAIFNWLFARRHKGKFILRIEDTDVSRSSEEMTADILEALTWLGVDWDEGPIYQSLRMNLYRQKASELVERGYAYYCFCSPEEIQKRKEEGKAVGKFWEYDRRCLNLSPEEKKKYVSEGRTGAIRFLVPETDIRYKDLLHGEISVKSSTIEDFVLLRNDGLPTYHLSVVVDDIDLEITHVIRGDDHISNTPKQLLLYRAFGAEPPEFAHQSLILGQDKKKLSKRHGVTSVLQFRDQGYLSLALFNFLALMSWSPGAGERVYEREEMIAGFSLDKKSRGNPVFDMDKLDWLNGQVINRMTAEKLASYVKDELQMLDLWQDDLEGSRKEWFFRLLDLLKDRRRTKKEFVYSLRPFLSDDFPFEVEGIQKYLVDERLTDLMPKLQDDFQNIHEFTADNIEEALRGRADKEGIKAAFFIHALRVLTLGMKVSPGIFDVLELLGKERTVRRILRLSVVKNYIK